jgi:hypothetical protein
MIPSRVELAVTGVVVLALLGMGAGWRVAVNEADKFERQLTASQTQVNDLTKEIAALKLAGNMDEQAAIESYEAADASCRQRIRDAVRAANLPMVLPERIENEDGTCPACDCPSVRLRDLQADQSDGR